MYYLVGSALQEVIATRSSVRNNALIIAASCENYSICARAPSRIRLVAAQDGELIVRALIGKTKAFVVVILMRVLIRAA